MSWALRRLDPLSLRGLKAWNALLRADQAAFARDGEALETLEDRLLDPARMVLVAEQDGQKRGLLDAVVDHPAPQVLTIAAIVVAASARRQGMARALCAEAKRLQPGTRLAAGVHDDNWAARAFFGGLGLIEEEEEDGVVWMIEP
ncbi:MAG: GNAT family N-acetyltransferase [Myxococcota bacterium]